MRNICGAIVLLAAIMAPKTWACLQDGAPDCEIGGGDCCNEGNGYACRYGYNDYALILWRPTQCTTCFPEGQWCAGNGQCCTGCCAPLTGNGDWYDYKCAPATDDCNYPKRTQTGTVLLIMLACIIVAIAICCFYCFNVSKVARYRALKKTDGDHDQPVIVLLT